MKIFESISIRSKIILIIQVITFLSVGIGLVLVVHDNIKRTNISFEENVNIIASLLAEYSDSPLRFSDTAGMQKLLGKVEAIKYVKKLIVYDQKSKVFAIYKDSVSEDYKKNAIFDRFTGKDSIVVRKDIKYDNKKYGYIELHAINSQNKSKMNDFIERMFILMFGLLFFSFFLAYLLQKIISEPILFLVGITEKISKSSDYSIRAKKRSDDEIGILYKAFNGMISKIDYYIKQLEKNNNELEEFNYVASHDLREPLRTLTSYCKLLIEDVGDTLSDDARRDLKHIIDASNRMNDLVKDLLELSRAGRVEFIMLPIDLNEVMQTAMKDLEYAVKAAKGKIQWDDLPIVYGDQNQIVRVFENLISNALKFRQAPPPEIQISFIEFGNCFEIAISDNGIGIEKQYIDQIFLPFKRLHGVGKYEGTGIGLAICKKIIERHEGSIYVESEYGKGSTFYLIFPKKQTEENTNLNVFQNGDE